ncbi:hypothetical protein ACIQOW_38965 [Kitasatospora sp. NPDC091335]|uniref:hypothetical protein n=1 Tax=Kitasatospora sp. NPDC091335 TaxID=3364085 RepID=UPI003802D705
MTLVHRHYLAYATARLTDGVSGASAVDHALKRARSRWTALLAGPSTAGETWHLLRDAVTAHRPVDDGRHAAEKPVDMLHRYLPEPLADAALLHRQLGLSATDAAHLMGTDAASVQAGLRGADRLMADVALLTERAVPRAE